MKPFKVICELLLYLQQHWVGLQLLSYAVHGKTQAERRKQKEKFSSIKFWKKRKEEFHSVVVVGLLSHSLRCRFVHFIQETNTRDVMLLSLSPHGQSLSLLVFVVKATGDAVGVIFTTQSFIHVEKEKLRWP